MKAVTWQGKRKVEVDIGDARFQGLCIAVGVDRVWRVEDRRDLPGLIGGWGGGFGLA